MPAIERFEGCPLSCCPSDKMKLSALMIHGGFRCIHDRLAVRRDQLRPCLLGHNQDLVARVDVDVPAPRCLELVGHMRPQHLDLEAAIELPNVIDDDTLPVNRLDVSLQRPLETSGMQEINGVRLRVLDELGKIRVILLVIVERVLADLGLSARDRYRGGHGVI